MSTLELRIIFYESIPIFEQIAIYHNIQYIHDLLSFSYKYKKPLVFFHNSLLSPNLNNIPTSFSQLLLHHLENMQNYIRY